jgi:hypothetical protein
LARATRGDITALKGTGIEGANIVRPAEPTAFVNYRRQQQETLLR